MELVQDDDTEFVGIYAREVHLLLFETKPQAKDGNTWLQALTSRSDRLKYHIVAASGERSLSRIPHCYRVGKPSEEAQTHSV